MGTQKNSLIETGFFEHIKHMLQLMDKKILIFFLTGPFSNLKYKFSCDKANKLRGFLQYLKNYINSFVISTSLQHALHTLPRHLKYLTNPSIRIL